MPKAILSEDVVHIPDLNFDQDFEEVFKTICLSVKAEYPDHLSIATRLLQKIEKIYAHNEDAREEYEYCLEAARQIMALEMTAFSGLIGAP